MNTYNIFAIDYYELWKWFVLTVILWNDISTFSSGMSDKKWELGIIMIRNFNILADQVFISPSPFSKSKKEFHFKI